MEDNPDNWVIGLTLAKARTRYDKIRPILVDGKRPLIVTSDVDMERINVAIEDGKITKVLDRG